MRAALTYVFCLVRSARKPVVRGVPNGLPGAGELRVLSAGPSTWLVATSVPGDQYDEAALAMGLQDLDWVGPRALAHEAVVERFLTATAVLPMQLFTLFTSDERAIEHVEKDRRRIEKILKRIERQHEWGLRLTWSESSATPQADGSSRRRGPASGKDYLAQKRDLLVVGRANLAAAKTAADRLYRTLARESTDARRRTNLERAAPGSRLLLDAAFLVPVQRAAAFRTALRTQAKKLGAGGVVVSLTGPWPPYNFV